MADITLQKTEGLDFMFDDAEWPRVTFKSSLVDLAQTVNTIGDLLELKLPMESQDIKEANTKQYIAQQVMHQYDELKTCPQHTAVFSTLNKIASSIGDNISSVFQVLQTSVQPEVESLRDQIDEKTKALIREDGTNVALLQDASLNTNFNTISFTNTLDEFGGAEEISRAFHDTTGYEATNNINDLLAGINILQLRIDEVALGDEAIADIVSRVKEKVESRYSEEQIKELLSILTVSYDFQAFVAQHLSSVFHARLCNVLCDNIACVKTFEPLIETFRSTPFNLPDELLDQIHANIEVLNKVIVLMKYSILVFDKIFSNTLIINETTLHQENMNAFLEAGGTKDDIAKFIFVYYTTKHLMVPDTGIAKDEVQQYKDKVEEEFASLNTSYQINADSLRRATLVRAARDVLQEYLLNTEVTRLPEGVSPEQFAQDHKYLVDKCVNNLDVREDSHLENCLFTFIIELWHDHSVVRAAHELFGAETLRQLEVNPDLSDDQLQLIDARVAAALASKFVIENLCDLR